MKGQPPFIYTLSAQLTVLREIRFFMTGIKAPVAVVAVQRIYITIDIYRHR